MKSAPYVRVPTDVSAARQWFAMLGLAAIVALAHGRSVSYGLFLDDHAHFAQLREADWSLVGLTRACRLDLVGDITQMWFLPEFKLRFFRPLAFGIMKLTYELTNWSPAALHVASIAWHFVASAFLLYFLTRIGISHTIAFLTSALFAVHPGHVATVQWIACQTELIVTVFTLASAICYARFRGWPGFVGESSPRGTRWAWLVGSIVLFAGALGCRENAIMLPFVLGIGDYAAGRQRRDRGQATASAGGYAGLVGVYVLYAAVVVAYLAIRWWALGGAALPPKPYVVTPNDPGFVRFIFDKAAYYLIGEFLLVPCVPIGGMPFFQQRPLIFYSLTCVAAVMLVFVFARYRERLSGWLAPVWLLAFAGPLLPTFASPHHLYLPGIGWAIAIALLIQSIAEWSMVALKIEYPTLRARVALGVIVGVLGTVFGVVTYFNGLVMQVAQQVEDSFFQEVIDTPGGLRDGDHLYFINYPLIGHYSKLAIERETGLKDLTVHVLTWSPRLLGNAPCPNELTQVDDRTWDVHLLDERYFAGPMGILVRDASGSAIPVQSEQSVQRDRVRVTMLDHDEQGVLGYRFEFLPPDPGTRRHLYYGSRVRWAYRVFAEESE